MMKTISLKLPDELCKKLERAARKWSQSKSEVVRAALTQFLERDQPRRLHRRTGRLIDQSKIHGRLRPESFVRSTPKRVVAMSTAPQSKLSASEYLELERRAKFKSEFFNGQVSVRTPCSREHNRIKENLVIGLGTRLKGGRCRTYSSDQRVLVEATGLYTYPDIIILCGQGTYDPLDRDTLTNPTAIIEVLSPSTERYDRGAKFRNYQQISSLVEYVLVAQDEAVCERYVRQADGSWALVSFVGPTATLAFTSVVAAIPFNDIYAGVALSEVPSSL
jgi:Uma2 family endonuclease